MEKDIKNKKQRKIVNSVNIKTTLPPNTITASYQQPKFENANNNKNRSLIVGVSNCGQTYLMNYILLQKQNQFL